jgi:glutathione peroxidase
MRTLLPLLALAVLIVPALTPRAASADEPKAPASVLDFTLKSIDGQDVNLAQFKGKVLLLVNTASQCGYTPQYKGLEETYEKYKGQGFEVLAFPANEFGNQEPGTNEEIKQFCTQRYHTTFPVFSKIVVKGPGIHPLYAFLTGTPTDPKFAGDIPWNFTKFLVDRQGNIVARFEPKDTPESPRVSQAIEQALGGGK